MAVWGMIDLGASPGLMSAIPDSIAVIGEVIIQILGAIDFGMLTLLTS